MSRSLVLLLWGKNQTITHIIFWSIGTTWRRSCEDRRTNVLSNKMSTIPDTCDLSIRRLDHGYPWVKRRYARAKAGKNLNPRCEEHNWWRHLSIHWPHIEQKMLAATSNYKRCWFTMEAPTCSTTSFNINQWWRQNDKSPHYVPSILPHPHRDEFRMVSDTRKRLYPIIRRPQRTIPQKIHKW